MINADVLIRARHVILIAHICVAACLLWEIQPNVKACVKEGDLADICKTYRSLAIPGLAGTLCISVAELFAFESGLTMFTKVSSIFSVVAHVIGSVILYHSVAGCHFDWFQTTFMTTSVLPAAVDVLCSVPGVFCRFD
ncbi:hypothetical protein K1T71_004161 [Dendrolimus kikuchii]|uniref:Uncharacterized protein n=1 Tax=Dendrolimus kikuchii TaxID=765133 RepID=A0ACC1DBH8_9NEOP|nr:hypothetical protein K1T71_004161 [Dendrolimus kikuchii]